MIHDDDAKIIVWFLVAVVVIFGLAMFFAGYAFSLEQ